MGIQPSKGIIREHWGDKKRAYSTKNAAEKSINTYRRFQTDRLDTTYLLRTKDDCAL